jgi:integrase
METAAQPRIVPNKRGIYEIRWTEGRRSRRISTGTRDSQEAAQFLLQWGARVSKVAAPAKIGPILESYWTAHGCEARSADTIRGHIRWLSQAFGFLDAEDLSPRDVTDYIRKRGKGLIGDREVSTGTIRRELGILKAALNHAADVRMIRRDSVPKITLPPDGPPRERFLDLAEIEALFAAATALRTEGRGARLSRIERFIAIALYTGARRDAILRLTWDRVDLANRLIDFRDPSLKITKKRRVALPISDALYPVLVRAHAEKRSTFVLDNSGSIRSSFARVCRQAGLDDVTPHVLRHTWASQASMRGVSLTDISRVLGNTLSVCERVYAKYQPDYLTAAVNAAYGGRTFDVEDRVQ